jgi:hypothetical protein
MKEDGSEEMPFSSSTKANESDTVDVPATRKQIDQQFSFESGALLEASSNSSC